MVRHFGAPLGVHIGQHFVDRRHLHDSGVHGPTQAGISGGRNEGADSIVLSGGYAADEDYGDYIIYTGAGGKDPNSRRQIANQSLDANGNAALVTSMVKGLPVRVTRGAHRGRGGSRYAPPSGLVYGGLFSVSNVVPHVGADGFLVYLFRLDRLPEQDRLVTQFEPERDPAFATTTVSRRIRDSALAREVKRAYGNRCQVCNTTIPGLGQRLYSEGAHIRPLGRPHLGADVLDNLLCLCPNHHTQLDIGGIVILDDFSVAPTSSLVPFERLRLRAEHSINVANIQYHRSLWIAPTPEPEELLEAS